jgi:hypothetical protein
MKKIKTITTEKIYSFSVNELRDFLDLEENETIKELYCMDHTVKCQPAKFVEKPSEIRVLVRLEK